MKYFLRTVLGLGLLLLGATVIAYDVYQLLQIGTCASGGPYVSARECPDGTAILGLTIPAGVFAMIAGGVIYGGRGLPPGSEGKGYRVNAIILIWCSLFLGIAFASLWGVWGPDANPGPGGKEGGLIVGFLFVLMGGGALPFLASREESKLERQAAMQRILGRAGQRAESFGQASGQTSSQPAGWSRLGGGDTVSKLERANKLRADGAITHEEFERLKRKILEDEA